MRDKYTHIFTRQKRAKNIFFFLYPRFVHASTLVLQSNRLLLGFQKCVRIFRTKTLRKLR